MYMKRTLFLFAIFGTVSLAFLPMSSSHAADSIEETKDDISDTEKDLKKAEAKAAALQEELQGLNQSLSTTVNVIVKTQDLIDDTEETIDRKKAEIAKLEEDAARNRGILRELILEAYYGGESLPIPGILAEEDMFRALNDPEKYLSVGERMNAVLSRIRDLRANIEEEKQVLEDTKSEHEDLLEMKERQKALLAAEHAETQADLQDQQTTITQLRSKLNSLRTEYSKLLGKSVSTDDILKAAKFAAGATGMSKAFLLGVLVQESNKGQNVGTCDYKESKMSSAQLTALKKIADELDYNYKKLKFSCPPKSYKGTGGAMGVAQFMPTTWLGYKSRIASLTGHNPPDPWNLVDGVTAMAIKLSNDGASKKDRFSEAKSYCVYLAGGNWGYYCYGSASKYKKSYKGVNCWGSSIKNYGEKVLCLKDNYEQFYD